MATVIKADEQHPRLLRRLETITVADHLGEARLLLEASRRKAQQLLDEANEEGERGRRHAMEKGYEAGFRRGYEAGACAGREAALEAARRSFDTDMAALTKAMEGIIDEFTRRKRDLFISARDDVVRFAVKVAERVTKLTGELRPRAVESNLEAALQLIEAETDIVARVHPGDLATLEQFVSNLKKAADASPNFSLVADEAMARGGCVLTTPDSEVDASLETQLGQIAAVIVGPERETS